MSHIVLTVRPGLISSACLVYSSLQNIKSTCHTHQNLHRCCLDCDSAGHCALVLTHAIAVMTDAIAGWEKAIHTCAAWVQEA